MTNPEPCMNIRALLEAQAAQRAQAVFAQDTESSHTLCFADLAQSWRSLGAWLAARGVGTGDTVSLVMPNGLNTLRLLLGAMANGICVNPVNLLSQSEQMRYVLEHSDCKLVWASEDWFDRVTAICATLPRRVQVHLAPADGGRFNDEHEDELPAPGAEPEPESLALLMYTSGTTGQPKGVMLTQANLVANAQAIATEHALTPADRVLGVLPLYHINAFAVTLLAPLASGGSVAVAPRFSGARFWAQAQGARCTWLNVVPTIIAFLLEGQTPPPQLTAALRFCRSASAALPPDHLQAFERRFGIGIIETMGLTETVAPAFSNPLDAAQRKLGSIGRASGGQACIIDAQGQRLTDGQTGELAIRGPHVMRGYYKNDAATQAAFSADGWLRTGDLGHRDADGFYFVTGRLKELIIKGGENIAPREIDEVLLRHPAVFDAACVGIPDARYGQEILAAIVLREGQVPSSALQTEVLDFCLLHLGRYKTPRVLRFVAELPRGPSGKVQRLKLAALADGAAG